MLKLRNLKDREIIRRIRNNDRTILGEIFTQYRKLVCGYITSHGGSIDDGNDILQECIIVVWQKACSDGFELTSKLSTYLMGIAKNKWMAESRKRKNILREELTPAIGNGNPSSLELFIKKEDRILIEKSLGEISPVCKKLLMMFYFEGRSLSNIASILKFANADVAKSKKYQCKEALAQILKRNMAVAERKTQ
jgi:RNA polymerase sigma factor (sigma-70 family)